IGLAPAGLAPLGLAPVAKAWPVRWSLAACLPASQVSPRENSRTDLGFASDWWASAPRAWFLTSSHPPSWTPDPRRRLVLAQQSPLAKWCFLPCPRVHHCPALELQCQKEHSLQHLLLRSQASQFRQFVREQPLVFCALLWVPVRASWARWAGAQPGCRPPAPAFALLRSRDSDPASRSQPTPPPSGKDWQRA